MVLLGLSYQLFKRIPKGADRGLYAGKGIMHGVKVTFSNKKTKKQWYPNVQRKKYFSKILDTTVDIRVTTAAMRCIDKAGGFDAYVYHTPEKKLQSLLGSLLQQRMKDVVEKFGLTPPDKVVRLHRRPRSWDNLDKEKEGEGVEGATTRLEAAAEKAIGSGDPAATDLPEVDSAVTSTVSVAHDTSPKTVTT